MALVVFRVMFQKRLYHAKNKGAPISCGHRSNLIDTKPTPRIHKHLHAIPLRFFNRACSQNRLLAYHFRVKASRIP